MQEHRVAILKISCANLDLAQKKSPDQRILIRGCPFFIPKPMNVLIPDKVAFLYSGRSSDFRITLITAPSHSVSIRTVAWCRFRSRLQQRACRRIPRRSLLSSFRAPEIYYRATVEQSFLKVNT